MKILITGSSGFVGKHLLKKLTPKYQIVRYDLKNDQNILDEGLLHKKLKDVDVVIHLAAFISVEESWRKPREYFINNSLGTLSVIQNSIKAGVKKVIYFSSAAVKVKPLTPYALSKITGENFIKLYSKNIKTVIVRPENIYGPGQEQSYGYVIHNFIKGIKEGKSVKIYGNGLQKRDFIYIDDVVSVIERILEGDVSNEIISIGTGRETSILNLAKTIGLIMKKKVTIDFEPKRPEPFRSVANTESLESLGISASKFANLKLGIQKLINIEYSG